VVWLHRLVGSTVRRVRTGWRAALFRMLRLTGAAIAAYLVAHWLLVGHFTAMADGGV
jgi:succinate dehydrogenase/fumarate reductase cytochrome b subunit